MSQTNESQSSVANEVVDDGTIQPNSELKSGDHLFTGFPPYGLTTCPKCDRSLLDQPASGKCPKCGIEYDEDSRVYMAPISQTKRHRTLLLLLFVPAIVFYCWLIYIAPTLAWLNVIPLLVPCYFSFQIIRDWNTPRYYGALNSVLLLRNANGRSFLIPWERIFDFHIRPIDRPEGQLILKQNKRESASGVGILFMRFCNSDYVLAFQKFVDKKTGRDHVTFFAPFRQCPDCRYDFAGLPADGACPECGLPYNADSIAWPIDRAGALAKWAWLTSAFFFSGFASAFIVFIIMDAFSWLSRSSMLLSLLILLVPFSLIGLSIYSIWRLAPDRLLVSNDKSMVIKLPFKKRREIAWSDLRIRSIHPRNVELVEENTQNSLSPFMANRREFRSLIRVAKRHGVWDRPRRRNKSDE